jgi:hypothetical protein
MWLKMGNDEADQKGIGKVGIGSSRILQYRDR